VPGAQALRGAAHLKSGARMGKPFLRQAAWSRSVASVQNLAIPNILEVMGSQ